MSVSGTMGQFGADLKPDQVRYEPQADLLALKLEAIAWEGNPASPKDTTRNRQFLANFAIHLVQQFRFEEAQLKQAKSPRLAAHRLANRRLAQQLRFLMTAVDQGLEVTSDIHVFLDAWRLHQEQVPVWQVGVTGMGH